MKLKDVTTLKDINEGDTLIITGHRFKNKPVKAHIVKTTKTDGTEIIFNKKKNLFFNLGMYLEGKSWVTKVKILV